MADYTLSPVSGSVEETIFNENKWSEKKDRQLRLWGVHGQERIDNANILLLNATSTGCEVLKNVVLPGFGSFNVVDGKKVTEEDLGNNFYVNKESLGKPRAQVVSQLLNEMNPDVKGAYLAEDPSIVIKKNPDFLKQFNFVIASNMNQKDIQKIESILYEENIPLIIVRTYGLFGTVRIVKKCHTVVEAKLEGKLKDLRLSQPWSELKEYALAQDMTKMNKHDYAHTPFLIILIQAMEEWKEKHGGLPKSTQEQEAFKTFVMGKNQYPDGNFTSGFDDVENRCYLAYTEPEIPYETQEVMDHPYTQQLTEDSENFFFLAHALSLFVKEKGVLPLMGDMPDFHSDSQRYAELKDIYWKKNRADMAALTDYLKPLLQKFGRRDIDPLEVKEFCKNAHYIRLLSFPTMTQEHQADTFNADIVDFNTFNDQFDIMWYFTLRAVEEYRIKYGQYPGDHLDEQTSERFQKEVKELAALTKSIVEEMKMADRFENPEYEKYAQEMVRSGKCELHNIASLIGGVAAQELIKLCTHQRIPFTSWIFDGIKSSSISLPA